MGAPSNELGSSKFTDDLKSESTSKTNIVHAKIPKKISLKQKMNSSFKDVSLHVLVEICKIKKPQKVTLLAAKVLCILVNSFRDEQYAIENFD
jgi:hypothetical protein